MIVQHIADLAAAIAPFVDAGAPGGEVHRRLTAAAANATVAIKRFANGFEQTRLGEALGRVGRANCRCAG
ncbi:MAG: hypothetical protein R3F65_25505 [bacterium]